MSGESRWFRSPAVVLAALAFSVAVVAEVALGRLGEPSDFSLFLGRFHPLTVHLPIGVLVLVGAAEMASLAPRLRQRIDPVLGLALPVLVIVTVAAFVLGHLLAREGGYPQGTLTLHRRLELFAVLGVCASAVAWRYQASDHSEAWGRAAYRAVLGVTFAVLSAGAHFGANLTHGESYLTKYAPAPLRRLLEGDTSETAPASSAKVTRGAPRAEPLVFSDVVQPALEKYCVECHGAEKSKGKLRLDSLEALTKGGENGPAMVAGDAAKSELVRRIRLPEDDDERMPPEGKPGPTPEELSVIEFWIERGATATLRVRDALPPAGSRALLESVASRAAKPVPGATAGADRSQQPSDAPAGAAPSDAGAESPRGDDSSPAAQPPSGGSEPSRDAATDSSESPAPPSPASAPIELDSGGPASPAAAASGARSGPAILAERCEKCHGASKRKGGLRVDSVGALRAGGESGPGLIPGDPARSEIVRRVRLPLASKEHMPPKKEPQLTSAEVAALAAWVRSLGGTSAVVSSKQGSASEPGASDPSTSERREPAESTVGPEEAPSEEEGGSGTPERAASEATAKGAAAGAESPPDETLVARLPERLRLYEEVVAPLLEKRCGKCHTGEKPAGRLRVDDHAALVDGGFSGPGIVPGKPEESFVVQRISLPSGDDDIMPPEGEPSLGAGEILLVRHWVERGARADDELPVAELPAEALRAAAAHVTVARSEPAAPHPSSGCAACSVGRAPASPWLALLAFMPLAGALALRLNARKSLSRGGRSGPASAVGRTAGAFAVPRSAAGPARGRNPGPREMPCAASRRRRP